jgi:hypothetical protein
MPGEVSEWFKVQLSKSCVAQATAGSNPALSASTGRDAEPGRLSRISVHGAVA